MQTDPTRRMKSWVLLSDWWAMGVKLDLRLTNQSQTKLVMLVRKLKLVRRRNHLRPLGGIHTGRVAPDEKEIEGGR
jgi:hypothetical protein